MGSDHSGKTMIMQCEQGTWTSPTEQMTNRLHPSTIAFPASLMELEMLSQRESVFSSGIATVMATGASLAKKRDPVQNAEPSPRTFDVSVYPNPFSGTTTIAIRTDEEARVRVFITDMLGRTVQSLMDGTDRTGIFSLKFEGAGLAEGTYRCHVSVNGEEIVRTIQLIRL